MTCPANGPASPGDDVLERISALGDVTGHLAHDFNNLLATISGSAALIEMGGSDRARHVQNIHAATQRGARLMRQLLALSPRTDAPLERLPVSLTLREAAVGARETLGTTHTLKVSAPEEKAEFHVDRSQFYAAIAALVDNARDAQPEGGEISLAACMHHITEDERAGSYVAVSVADQGAGIPPAARPRIFEPFFTTKPKSKGTGLGLPIVLRIARRHGGFVEVVSETGKGTQVTCYFALDPRTGG